jgi:Subtilase family
MRRAPRIWTLAILFAGLACACSRPVRIESSAFVAQAGQAPDRFIIAAVDNDAMVFLARAGGTPRGYDSITVYGPSAHARQTVRSIENDYGLREVSAWPIEALHVHCVMLEIPEGADRAVLLAKLSSDPRVKLAQPLQTFATRSQDYNDPYVALQRGFQRMDVAGAHPWSRGEGVKVAIIDTGADTLHPDLRDSISVAENLVDSDKSQFQRDRHGTEIAGVIAAVANNRQGIVGVAPGARLVILKACWQTHVDADAARCNSYTLALALAAAFDARAQVINLSLAGPEDPLLRALIGEGQRRGILFVGAATADALNGKAGLSDQAGIIEVASAENGVAPGPVVYAPGREILTLLPGGHYDFVSGDSIATAEVTGVVALLLARDHGLSAATALQLLQDNSVHQVVNACAAVVALVGRGSCAPSAGAERNVALGHD